jgi:hypothetical protein
MRIGCVACSKCTFILRHRVVNVRTESEPTHGGIMARVLSLHQVNFSAAIQDVDTLLSLHDKLGPQRDRPLAALEVLKRSAIILTVTAWEAFVEDAIRVSFEQRISKATCPKDVNGTFCAIASGWLNSSPKPLDLPRWTGDGWKEILKERCMEEIKDLNTPNSDNIRRLSKRYLGWDITSSWKWGAVTPSSACRRLDKLIQRRGELVHCGKKFFEKRTGVRRKEAGDALALVKRLVACSSRALAQAP